MHHRYGLIRPFSGATPTWGWSPGWGGWVGGLLLLVGFHGLARGGVTVAPAVTELTVGSGKTAKGVFRVRNDSDVGQVVEVQPERWPPGSEGEEVASWLDVFPRKLDLGPGKEGIVRYAVRVPVSADGELGAQVYFASSVSQAGALPLIQRFGCALYVRVKGTERYDLRLARVAAQRRESETVFQIVLENRGNVHVRPGATLNVATSGGTQAVVMEGKSPIYAGTKRTFFARLKGNDQVLEKSQGVVHLTFQAADGERTEVEAFQLE